MAQGQGIQMMSAFPEDMTIYVNYCDLGCLYIKENVLLGSLSGQFLLWFICDNI